MIVIFSGDREWTDEPLVRHEIVTLPAGTIIRQGLARGLDKMARRIAIELGYPVQDYPVIDPWPRGGPMRNQRMLDTEPRVDLVKAFHNNIMASKGTADMVMRARKALVPVRIYSSDGMVRS